jgi:hypothetical protein
MPSIQFEGLDIQVSRSISQQGKLVIDINTSDLDHGDVFPNYDIPQLIICINEERLETTEDGGWKIGHGAGDPEQFLIPPSSLR